MQNLKTKRARGRISPDPTATRPLAKLSRPHFKNTVLRPRLYDLLDACANRHITWIASSPGSGKTTLVSAYLENKKIEGIWYQIDSGDSDVASFFYYLGMTVSPKSPKQNQRLPILKPEYLADLEGFTRRFFREYYAFLEHPSVIVLDNYQEAAIESALHKVLVWALNEVPQGIRIIIISRTSPPSEYAHGIANSLIALIGWEDMRLTLDETESLTAGRLPISSDLIAELHVVAAGWAAGVVLLLERFKQTGTVNHLKQSDTLETVFNYFAEQIFNQLDKKTVELLMCTSLFPHVTEVLAKAVTDPTGVLEVLDDLHKRQLFVDRRIGTTNIYQYHALFRQFLQTRAQTYFGTQHWHAIQIASAQALENQSQPGDAVILYIEAQAWKPAILLILDQASELLAVGRWLTLQQWILLIPKPLYNANPWLGYWLGMCQLRIDPAKGRTFLEPAFDAFINIGDVLGQAVTATAVLEAHLTEWIDYRRLERWISFLEDHLSSKQIIFPSLDIELAVRASLFTAIINRQTHREDIPILARQLLGLLRKNLDPNYKLLAARGLFTYIANSGDFNLTDEVMICTLPAFKASGASAVNRAWYATRLGFVFRYTELPLPDKTLAWFETARRIIREDGLFFMETSIACYRAWAEDVVGDFEEIQQQLGIFDEYRNAESSFDAAFRRGIVAFLSAHRSDYEAAVTLFEDADRYFQESNWPLARAQCLIGLTVMLVEASQHQKAREVLSEARQVLFSGPFPRYWSAILKAVIAFREGEEELARTELSLALSIGAKHSLEYTLSEHLFRNIITELAVFALRNSIELDYVKLVIQSHRLFPPSRDCDEWPWPVKIYALGDFSLEIDGYPLVFSGKTPKKSLALIKALVVTESGKWEMDRLGSALWPDADGDAVRNTFHVTHLRLRQLLGRDDLIVVKEGTVALNTDLIWTDVTAFERLVSNCLDMLHRGAPITTLEALSDRVFLLYRGDLLKNDPDAPWLIAARDRTKSKWLRCLKALGAFWEQHERWDTAQTSYERILEHDGVAEDIYRHLMRCHINAGHPSEALRTYRRCRQMLSNVLGITPSAETEAIIRDISKF